MTFHGYIFSPISFKEKIYHQLAVILTAGNLCIGDFIPQHFGTKADAISYGGVEVEEHQSRSIPQSSTRYEALFIGRFSSQTGLAIYLDTIQLLQKDNSFKTLFLGDGDDQLRTRAADLGTCVGWVDDVKPYFEQAQFVFASRYLSMLEAFAAKKLVFAVYQAADEVKRDYLLLAPFAKWLVIAQTPEELATQVRYYHTHPAATVAKTKAAYQWVQGQTWSRLAQKYLTLWYSTETYA